MAGVGLMEFLDRIKEQEVNTDGSPIVDRVIERSYEIVEQREFLGNLNNSPHGRAWGTSFHASSFPGDQEKACPRAAMYGMMEIPKSAFTRSGRTVMDAGKDIELNLVRRVRDAGFLARSNQPGRSSDPEARDENGKQMPQMGFVDAEHWLTGSVDMPILPFDYDSTLIVEIKSKHESHVEEMQNGARSFDAKHRRQLLCSLGLASESPQAFLHPTEDHLLKPAKDGVLYYIARDTSFRSSQAPRRHEFYFSHSPSFMEQGRAHLKGFQRDFREGRLREENAHVNTRTHPLKGYRWSEGECKFCPFKRQCRADHAGGVTKLADSSAIAAATFTRPGYDYPSLRSDVFSAWDEKDPLSP